MRIRRRRFAGLEAAQHTGRRTCGKAEGRHVARYRRVVRKERMRAEDAVYGGEMNAHHYFRDFAYCDSGMLPWLLVASLVPLALELTGR